MTHALPLALVAAALFTAGCDLRSTDGSDDEVTPQTNDDDHGEAEADDGDGEPAEGGAALAEVAADAGEAVSGESALVATVASGAAAAASQGATNDEAVAEAAATEASLTAMCAYGGTVTASVVGNAVTYSFFACSSHCGMHRATGDVVVTYSLLPDGVGVDLFAENFRIDGTTTDLDLNAEHRVNGTVAAMSITTDAAVRGLFGWEITRSGRYDASFDASTVCIAHDGEWTTTFGEAAYTTTLSDYRRCALQCPQAGSKLAFQDAQSGFTFEAEFTTPTTLQWSLSTGATGTLELPACG